MLEVTLTNVVLVLFLAFVNEVLVEHLVGKPLERALPEADRWWLIYVALVSGAALSWFSGLDLFTELPIPPMVGLVLTALLVGGGSPLIHQIINKARDPLAAYRLILDE